MAFGDPQASVILKNYFIFLFMCWKPQPTNIKIIMFIIEFLDLLVHLT